MLHAVEGIRDGAGISGGWLLRAEGARPEEMVVARTLFAGCLRGAVVLGNQRELFGRHPQL